MAKVCHALAHVKSNERFGEARALPCQNYVDVSDGEAMVLPCKNCSDVSETVAKALPCQSCADLSGSEAKALPCQSFALFSELAGRPRIRLAVF